MLDPRRVEFSDPSRHIAEQGMARSDEQVDTVVIGAGQAGLCMSCFLQKKNLQHVVLERGRIGERWRSERWDTLRFQFESNIANLPGFPFAGEDKSTFMHRDDVVRILDNYAAFTRAPVRCGVEVNRLSRPADKPFQVRFADHVIEARNVVAATGPYQRAIIPDISHAVPNSVVQVPANRYCNPDQLPEGTTLVVGAGSSGYQIAEDLLESGRRVILAAGRHRALPRRYRGRSPGIFMQPSTISSRRPSTCPK